MGYLLKPLVPTGYTFGGQMVYPATVIEIPDTAKLYVDSVQVDYDKQYEIYSTGWEHKKYKIANGGNISFNIMFVGNSPKWLVDQLFALAIAVNGAGMPLLFYDDFVMGASGSPLVYECRWINAGDFVETSEIIAGANMQLIAYDLPANVTVAEYQKVIATPESGLEWDLYINESGTTHQYYRSI
jgi:hypothetical protein